MTSYNEKIKRLGYTSPKEYRDKIAKRHGYKDFDDYRRQWRAKRKKEKDNDDGYRGYP